MGLEVGDKLTTDRPDALFICTPLFADKDVAKLPLDTDSWSALMKNSGVFPLVMVKMYDTVTPDSSIRLFAATSIFVTVLAGTPIDVEMLRAIACRKESLDASSRVNSGRVCTTFVDNGIYLRDYKKKEI